MTQDHHHIEASDDIEVSDDLPEGFRARPANADDVAAVTAIVRATEVAVLGYAEVIEADVAADWRRPGFDVAVDAVMVLAGDRPVAQAELWRVDAEANVMPEEAGHGIGAWLLGWIERRALASSGAAPVRVRQMLSDRNAAGIDLLTSRGYAPLYTAWDLSLPDGVHLEHRAPPPGIQIRPFDPATESDAAFEVVETAFREWPDYEPKTLAVWRAKILKRDDHDPNLQFVALDGDTIVGVALCIAYPEEGWVQSLAVAADYRGRGIATALLLEAFGAFRRRGLPRMGLATDSRTGALDLYRNIGMQVRQSLTAFEKTLPPPRPA
jgi:GNAT superfamily N-acetyltransferase